MYVIAMVYAFAALVMGVAALYEPTCPTRVLVGNTPVATFATFGAAVRYARTLDGYTGSSLGIVWVCAVGSSL